MEQNREPRHRPTGIQSTDFWQRSKGRTMEKEKSFPQMAWKQMDIHMPKNKTKTKNNLDQRFSTSVPQEFLKHVVPDYFVRGTDLLSLRLSNFKMTTANTTAVTWMNQNYTYFFVTLAKNVICCLVCCRILVISLCVPWDEKGWKTLI